MKDFVKILILLAVVFGGGAVVYLLRNYVSLGVMVLMAIILGTAGMVAFILILNKRKDWRHHATEEEKRNKTGR